MQVGRNMQEIERILVALQTSDKEMVCTPANWEKGDDVIVPFYPYKNLELISNPELSKNFYNVGGFMWFRRENNFNEENSAFDSNLSKNKDSSE
jgi:peroxiredoxin (alkyl hydroperoxide reductase subunit C)